MMRDRAVLSMLVCLIGIGKTCAQTDLLDAGSPWEAEDIPAFTEQVKRVIAEPQALTGKMISGAVGFYRGEIGPRSVERCPFLVSCSRFLIEAVRKYGLLIGLAAFIDRNLYRENPHTLLLYPLVERQDGVLKLDDRHYLWRDAAR